MEPEPVFGEPVLRSGTALAIADVHIGVEKNLIHAGAVVPSQVDAYLERLAPLARTGKSTSLIIVGDLKHTVGYSTPWERREVPRFLEGAREVFSEVHLVRGNHDAGIEELVPDGVYLHTSGGWTDGRTGWAHGHRWPSKDVMEADVLVVGHNHPVYSHVDALGKVSNHRCWLRADFRESHARYPQLPRELIKMPAFNPLMGGAPVNVNARRLRGPLMRPDVADVAGARVFLEDGTFMGALRELPQVLSTRRRRKGDNGM